MSKSARQKLKLLYLKDILLRETDEEHPLNASELIAKLEKEEIEAERKSIYNDVAMLADYGLDLLKLDGRTGGYFVGARDFELAELKLLVDAVRSSRFITEKKSNELVEKLSSLASIYDADKLKRQVYAINKAKSPNESVLITIDTIHDAIQKNHAVAFEYMMWSREKKLVPRHPGKRYQVSPIALVWDDEFYYLLGFDSDDRKRKNFRVDKIRGIEELSTERAVEGKEVDIAAYTNKVFGMFGGDLEPISLRCPNGKTGIFLDRFGTDISVTPMDAEYVRVHTEIAVSEQFFGWLFSLGSDIELLGSRAVRDRYMDYLEETLKNYRK
ncbi:MAG: WYL domain-containing protein [Lachnospiraceae bacterium]|nr:WYL domain-containing protein [Lachnospiraceae bacterium]